MKASFFSVSLALAALALAVAASDSADSTSTLAMSVGDGQTTVAEETYCESFQTYIPVYGRVMIDMPYCYCGTDYLSDEYVYGYMGSFYVQSFTSFSGDKYYVQYGDQYCPYSGSPPPNQRSDFKYHSSYFDDFLPHYGTFGPSYAYRPCFCPTVAVECANTNGYSCYIEGEVCFSLVPLKIVMQWWIILLITFGTVLVVAVIVTIAVINSRMRRSSSGSDDEPLIKPTAATPTPRTRPRLCPTRPTPPSPRTRPRLCPTRPMALTRLRTRPTICPMVPIRLLTRPTPIPTRPTSVLKPPNDHITHNHRKDHTLIFLYLMSTGSIDAAL